MILGLMTLPETKGALARGARRRAPRQHTVKKG